MRYKEGEDFKLPSICLLGHREINGKALKVINATNSSLYLGKNLIEFNLNFLLHKDDKIMSCKL